MCLSASDFFLLKRSISGTEYENHHQLVRLNKFTFITIFFSVPSEERFTLSLIPVSNHSHKKILLIHRIAIQLKDGIHLVLKYGGKMYAR